MSKRGGKQRTTSTGSARHPLIPLPADPISIPSLALAVGPGPPGSKTPEAVDLAPPIEILLAMPSGLIADLFARWLAQLQTGVRVHRCDPLERPPATVSPKLIIVGLDAAFESPTSLIARFAAVFPSAPIVALAASVDAAVIDNALRAGARTYISTAYDEAHVLQILRKILNHESSEPDGESPVPASCGASSADIGSRKPHTVYRLTPAELEVLSYLCDGLSILDIAIRRDCGEGSIKAHLHHIYRKMGVKGCKQAIPIGQKLPEVRALQRARAGSRQSAYGWLIQRMKTQTRQAGEILFRKGDSADKLYFVQEGTVLLVEIGKELGADEWIGEIGIFSEQGTRTCTAQCKTNTRLCWLAYEEAQQLFHQQSEFAFHITRLIANRLREDSERARRNA